MANPSLAEKNLRRKVQAWRTGLHDLLLYFLPGEYGGSDLTDLGIMCGNTQESLDKAKGIARRAGFSSENPGFDVDGDGATTTWDVEAWLADPTRSPVPNLEEEGSAEWGFDYGVTNGDRVQQEEFLRSELQRLRTMEADLLHEWIAGEFDKTKVSDREFQRLREDVSRLRTKEYLARGRQQDGWPLVAALAAIGVARGAAGIVLVGYAWQLLRGGWTRDGVGGVDADVQGAEALREESLQRAPQAGDLRRLGDQWDPKKNCPSEAPRSGSGPMRLIEDVKRWGRALVDPFTRWFLPGSLLGARVHDSAITTWWRRVVSDADMGRLKPGEPSRVRLTRIAPVPAFSDDPPQKGVVIGEPGHRTFLGPDFEIRERVPAPIPGGQVVKAPPDHTLRIVDAQGNFVRFVEAGGEGIVPPGGRAEVMPTAAEFAAITPVKGR